ncbi:dihydrofolate reductase [Clostridia bacterium]|nr:dihydrofolate reductase [Clostridia bacterium]
MNKEGIIGIDHILPWHIPSELKHFKQYTMGNTVIMGRKTFESIGSKPLTGRNNVVLSTCREFGGACMLKSIDELHKYPNGIVMGGEMLYRQVLALNLIDEICLTLVNIQVTKRPGQIVSFFPTEYLVNFDEVKRETNDEDGYDIIWYRKKG